MTLYLTRHGESFANIDVKEHYKTPNAEIELTDKGKEQAAEVGERLFDKIPAGKIILWSSPYKRAVDTAAIINKKFKKAELRQDILLVERNWGHATGYESTEAYIHCCKYADTLPTWDVNIAPRWDGRRQINLYAQMGDYYTFSQGEAKTDVAMRAEIFLQKISRENSAHIVVSHMGLCLMLHSQVTGEYFQDDTWDNGEIRVYKDYFGKWRHYGTKI